MATVAIDRYLEWVPELIGATGHRFSATCDEEADVLSINVRQPPATATDSELRDDDVLVRYEGGEVIGLTVLNAGRHARRHG